MCPSSRAKGELDGQHAPHTQHMTLLPRHSTAQHAAHRCVAAPADGCLQDAGLICCVVHLQAAKQKQMHKGRGLKRDKLVRSVPGFARHPDSTPPCGPGWEARLSLMAAWTRRIKNCLSSASSSASERLSSTFKCVSSRPRLWVQGFGFWVLGLVSFQHVSSRRRLGVGWMGGWVVWVGDGCG